MSTEVPVDAPWNAPRAARARDRQTLEAWVRENSASERFRALVPAATRPIFGAEPRELSLLFVLFYIAASGDERNVGTFERNFNTRDGAQECRFVGGSQRICERSPSTWAARGPPHAGAADRAGQGGVRVESTALTRRGKRVIVAMPPVLAGRIDYSPACRPSRDALTRAAAAGHPDQGDGRLRQAVLAREGPQRHRPSR